MQGSNGSSDILISLAVCAITVFSITLMFYFYVKDEESKSKDAPTEVTSSVEFSEPNGLENFAFEDHSALYFLELFLRILMKNYMITASVSLIYTLPFLVALFIFEEPPETLTFDWFLKVASIIVFRMSFPFILLGMAIVDCSLLPAYW